MALNTNYQAEVGISFNDSKLQKQINSLKGKTIELDVKVKGGLGNLNKALKDTNKLLNETRNSLKNVEKSTKNLDTSSQTLERSTQRVNTGLSNTARSARSTADAFNHTSNHGKTFSKLMTDITKKVLAFGGVTAVIMKVRNAMAEAVQITKDYDAALTDFKKVSDLSGDSLENYSKKLGKYGEDVYRTRTEMLQSATLFKQAGYSDDDSARLAKMAELYKNVADGQLSSGDASAFIVSQMKAFNITADNSITILDKVNEVSNNFAVSSTDIANGLTKNSASLAAYGNTLNESIALITAGTEIMTGKATQVSNGLKSIGANIIKLANQYGELKVEANGSVETISLIDKETGDLKSTYQVLSEVAGYWDKMSKAEQSALALSLAG